MKRIPKPIMILLMAMCLTGGCEEAKVFLGGDDNSTRNITKTETTAEAEDGGQATVSTDSSDGTTPIMGDSNLDDSQLHELKTLREEEKKRPLTRSERNRKAELEILEVG